MTTSPRTWWLHGAPCAGKSATAWALHTEVLAGRPRAFFDVDQVGMCFPEPADDPGRYRLKARSAAALVRHLHAAGARTVVVSGVLDDASRRELPGLVGAPVTFCRLRTDLGELGRRLRRRYGPDDAERVLAEERQAEEGAGDLVVDTGGAAPGEVARRALAALVAARSTAPGAVGPTASVTAPAPRPGRAVLLCGATGVGTSTVGFGLLTRLAGDGTRTSYLDLQQLGSLADVLAEAATTAAAVAAVWAEHRAAGAQVLVLAGHVDTPADVEPYRAALGGTPLTVHRLAAGRDALHARLLERTRGPGPELAGDALVGLSADRVLPVLQDALAEQERLGVAGLGDVVHDTDGVPPQVLVDRVAAAVAGSPAVGGNEKRYR